MTDHRLNDAHRAALDAYLGSVRTASEEFFEAYRAQTEALRRLTDRIEATAGDTGDTADTSAEPGRATRTGTDRAGQAGGTGGFPGGRGGPALFNDRRS